MIWERKLKDWQTAGLMDANTASNISKYELKRSSERPYIFYGFLSLGAIAIIIGIISLISFNWKDIPDVLKLSADFLIFIILAGLILLSQWRSWKMAFEVLLILFCLWIPASIGLISQVFHQSGELHDALLLSCALSFPLVLFSRKALLVHLWLAAFTFSSYEGILERFFSYNEILFFMLGLISTYFITGSILLHQRTRNLPIQQALNLWGLGVLVYCVWVFSFVGQNHVHNFALIIALISTAVIVLLRFVIMRPAWPQLIALVFTGIIASFLISFELHDMQWLSAFSCIGVMLSLAAYFASKQNEKIFHFFMIAAGIRVYAVYLEVFGDLAETGIGLILSGFVLIGMGLAYWFLRNRLLSLARNITK